MGTIIVNSLTCIANIPKYVQEISFYITTRIAITPPRITRWTDTVTGDGT